jgi:hypothetical protein
LQRFDKKVKLAYDKAESEKNTLTRSIATEPTEFARSLTRSLQDYTEEADSSPTRDPELCKRGVRKALLKDIYKQTPEWGFDITSFKSIDDDELFVCVSLTSHEAITYYIDRDSIDLQLRGDIAARLGVDQDQSDPCSSPPSIPFDRRTIRGLCEQGLTTSENGDDLFREYVGSGKGACISSMECFRIVYGEFARCVDLGAAQDEGLVACSYAVHNPKRIAELKAMWANWGMLMDFSFEQPIPYLRDYFGTRVAFLFAWNGVYCKGLLALVLVSLIQVIVVWVLQAVFGIYLLKNKQVIGFCIVVVVWARLVFNLWEREERFFVELWNLHETSMDTIVRPEFIGVLKESTVDANIKEKVFPKASANWRIFVSSVVTMLTICFVGSCIFFWMVTFEGHMGVVSSILLSLQIKFFGWLFLKVARMLTNYENHKYQDGYHNSFLWKLFLFEFVNNYSAFFFMTLWGGHRREPCINDDCLALLRSQLVMTLAILILCSVIAVIVQDLLVHFFLWWEVRQYRQQFGKEPPPRLPLEAQSKYVPIDETEEVMTMLALVMALGYVFLFAGVAAPVVPLVFLVCAVKLRSFAILFTSYSQRPMPQMTRGIGNWSLIVRYLMSIGIVFSGYLFAAFGSSFEGAQLLSKMTGFFLFCASMFATWSIVDMVVPPYDGEATLLASRRQYLNRKFMLKADCAELRTELQKARQNQEIKFNEEIEKGEWTEVPHLNDLPEASPSPEASPEVKQGPSAAPPSKPPATP